jgi:hypothetical protein
MTDTTAQNTTETKTSKRSVPKKTAKAKAAAPTVKAARAAKPKAEKKPKEPREDRSGWGTFALKMPIPEREAIHAASGAAGASRFARIVLNAFSNEDEAAFKNAITEARKIRA